MYNSHSYFKNLLSLFIRDEIGPEQIRELYRFIETEPDVYDEWTTDAGIKKLIAACSAHSLNSLSEETSRTIKNKILAHADQDVQKRCHELRRGALRRTWYWAAAAAVVILLGIGLNIRFSGTPDQQHIAVKELRDIPAPASNRAMITLANGNHVYLDSVGNGQLAEQGDIKLVKLADGRIAYQAPNGTLLDQLQFNTLTNPRGSKVIDMQLADGTHVWLNAGSSITYPVAFLGNERRVELMGEGYFEVAKDLSKRFIVNANGTVTQVLGTHFNVNAYDKEPEVKVTLLEGSIRLSTVNTHRSTLVKPGQQATFSFVAPSAFQLSTPDLDQVMAWKTGVFNLNNIPLKELMQQISNWYDVDVVYVSALSSVKLFGEMDRNLTLSELVEGLQGMDVYCKLEGRTLYVGERPR